jgi:hypothetical protein
MDRLTLACIILIIMLFAGIGIMMAPPTKITAAISGRSNGPMLGAVIWSASILTVTGLVGIGVLGFIISKD